MILRNRATMTKHGMTLVELLITLVMILILMGTFVWMIVWVKSAYQSSVTHTRLRQELQISFSTMAADMMNSSYSTLTDATSQSTKAFSFLSAADLNGVFSTDGNGSPVWKKYVIYYVPGGSRKLLRKEVYGSFTAALSTTDLNAYCDGKGKHISSSLSQMTCTPDSASKSCVISITLESTNYNGKTDSQSRDLRVFFRN